MAPITIGVQQAMRFLTLAFIAILAVAGEADAQVAPLLGMPPQGFPTLAPLVKRVAPGVVNIAVKGRIAQQQNPLFNDPFFRRFFNVPDVPAEREFRAAGSGVIVDAREGLVITNRHVVEHADEITVTLTDGRHLRARNVGADPDTDIAVIKVTADDLVRAALWRFRPARGRRFRRGDRQSVRSRPDRHLGHRQRAGPHRPRHRGL